MPNSLYLVFDIDLSGGDENNFLVQNVSRALVDQLVVKFGDEVLQNTFEYDIYKIFEDLFLSEETRQEMLMEGIQSEDLCKIRSNAGDKKTSGVDAENKLAKVYKNNYCVHLDHQILSDHGVFYPHALYHLIFEITLASAAQVVRGSDVNKLVYKLTNIQLQYETISSKSLAKEATNIYLHGKDFAYDLVKRAKVITFAKGTQANLDIHLNRQRRSLKAILLLFIEPYAAGARDSEKYFNPDITKVHVTINGVPNRIYNTCIHDKYMWKEISRFFGIKGVRSNMNLPKYITDSKFGLLIDLRSMADTSLHGNGVRLVNTQEGVQLEIERETSGSGNVHCHFYPISDAQMSIGDRQLVVVQH